MPSTTNYNFGDVVLVAFPFTNLRATKKRPAVVISDTAYQQGRPYVVLMAITSQVRQPLAFDEYIVQGAALPGTPKRRGGNERFALSAGTVRAWRQACAFSASLVTGGWVARSAR